MMWDVVIKLIARVWYLKRIALLWIIMYLYSCNSTTKMSPTLSTSEYSSTLRVIFSILLIILQYPSIFFNTLQYSSILLILLLNTPKYATILINILQYSTLQNTPQYYSLLLNIVQYLSIFFNTFFNSPHYSSILLSVTRTVSSGGMSRIMPTNLGKDKLWRRPLLTSPDPPAASEACSLWNLYFRTSLVAKRNSMSRA